MAGMDGRDLSTEDRRHRRMHALYDRLLPFFRRRRMRRFIACFRPGMQTRILDVGGGLYNWELVGCTARITILNLTPPADPRTLPPYVSSVQGDGRSLPFPDSAFDVVCANSVIEHLSTFEDQFRFAAEVRRVARGVWVQTPARWFPVEPHLLTPFVHFLPRRIQRRMLRNFTLWGLLTRPSPETVDRLLGELRLLTRREMRALFPDCRIERERFLFCTKAFLAVRRSG